MSTHNMCFPGELRKIKENVMWIPFPIWSYINPCKPHFTLYRANAISVVHCKKIP